MTKRMTVFLLIVSIVLALTLTACGKTALTTEQFIEKAEDYGMQTGNYEGDSSFKISEATEAFLFADDGGYLWNCEFLVFDDEKNAKDCFEDSTKDHTGADNSATKNVDNSSIYEGTSDDWYVYICRVGSTMLHMKVNIQYQEDAIDFAKKLDYYRNVFIDTKF